ncbi:MAG: thiolase family protein [bacterium JZ-2024 1]
MREVMVLSAVRTAIGKFGGGLSEFSAVELGSIVVAEAIRRAGISPESIPLVIMGNVLQAGLGQNPARQCALKAGVSPSASAFTVNMVCGSGLKAINLAAQAIQTGEVDVVVAGGMESMSNAPYLLYKARWGQRMGHTQLVDVMLRDGLEDAFSGFHMGNLAEKVARKFHITREEADNFSLRSHQKAAYATEKGWFQEEIVPVRKKDGTEVMKDEGIRPDTSLEKLAKLTPVFQKDGIVTAGNSSQLSDAASAVVLASEEFCRSTGSKPLARIAGWAEGGMEPEWVLITQLRALENLKKKFGWRVDDFDFIEINETFAPAMLALQRELGIPEEKYNPRGGGIALGHPIGCSGARILTTLLYELRQNGKKRGVATLCLGGGNAVATALEIV